VIDFCARHGIGPDIEVVRIQDLNGAFTRVEQGEVRFPLRHRHGVTG
jgi:uncharacterized zinc-type alcohol dehydrogenase-like protein